MSRQYYYAVAKGKNTGIFLSWEKCKENIIGVSNSDFKKFRTLNEAQEYMNSKNNKKFSMTSSVELTDKQQEILDYILLGHNTFITGSAGVGKGEIIKKFVILSNQKGKYNIGITSTTGISALLIKGTTLHSFLGIGLGDGTVEQLFNKIKLNRKIYVRWQKLESLVIDEISMLTPVLFDKLENLARMIKRTDQPFGGIQLILVGDFCQLPPVRSYTFCFEAENWDRCIEKTFYLKDIIRQSDKDFQICLNKIRVGIIDDDVKNILNTCIKKELKNDIGIFPTKLFSHNDMVDEINNIELMKLADTGSDFYEFTMEFVSFTYENGNTNSLYSKYRKICNAVDSVKLCINAQVILIWNIDITGGLVNGSRGIVIGFDEASGMPMVKFLNGRVEIIYAQDWEITENEKRICLFRQIPLKIAYAISIHSCQGSTLDYAEMDLSRIFEFGMCYTALSRLKNLEGLSIIDINYDKIKAHPLAIEFYEKIEKM